MDNGQMTTQGRWILVPGTLCTPAVFDPLLDHLGVAPDQRTAVTVDKPSVGEYAATLDGLVRPGDIVCGFSLGSIVVAQNLEAVKQARAVVLLALNPLADPIAKTPTRHALRDRILTGGAESWVRENWPAMSTDTGSDVARKVVKMAEDTLPLIESQTALAISRPDARRDLIDTTLPLVFVTGAQDRMTPPDPVVAVAGLAKRATVRVPDGLGHFALLEAPNVVAQAIRDGLEQVLKDD